MLNWRFLSKEEEWRKRKRTKTYSRMYCHAVCWFTISKLSVYCRLGSLYKVECKKERSALATFTNIDVGYVYKDWVYFFAHSRRRRHFVSQIYTHHVLERGQFSITNSSGRITTEKNTLLKPPNSIQTIKVFYKSSIRYFTINKFSFFFYKNNFYKNKGSNSQKLRLKIKNTLLNVLRLSRFGVFL